MAFTTVTDFSVSAADIITEALEQLGILGEGESPNSDQITSSLRTLNMMVKLWGADYNIYAQKQLTVDLVASTQDYFFGNSAGAYIPQKIISATLTNTTTNDDVPLTIITRDEWEHLSNKTKEGTPTLVYYKTGAVNESATFSVWPVPQDTTYDIDLWVQYPVRDLDAGTDDLYFPQEWFLALAFGLAYYLAPKYGVNGGDRDRLGVDMETLRNEAESYITDGSVYFQPDLTRNG